MSRLVVVVVVVVVVLKNNWQCNSSLGELISLYELV